MTIIILAVANWPAITHNPFLYDYLFGQYGVTSILNQSNSLLDPAIFEQAYTYYIALALIAVLTGIAVYIVLQSFSRGVEDAREALSEIEEAGSSRRSVEAEIGVRWAVRTASIVLWAVYLVFFTNALLPFCLLTTRQGTAALNQANGWAFELLGFMLLWLGLHQHVIFARLTLLRPRIFGGGRAINNVLYGN